MCKLHVSQYLYKINYPGGYLFLEFKNPGHMSLRSRDSEYGNLQKTGKNSFFDILKIDFYFFEEKIYPLLIKGFLAESSSNHIHRTTRIETETDHHQTPSSGCSRIYCWLHSYWLLAYSLPKESGTRQTKGSEGFFPRLLLRI